MSRQPPPLTWLRSFEAAARNLSFTVAAEEIGLTQSAVSQQIKSLELRLGIPLFVRKSRSLALTDDGRKLAPKVAAALGALSAATEPFDRGIGHDMLTVATSVSVAQWVIAPRLPDFAELYPDVRVRLLSAVWPDDFSSSQADVEIRFGSPAQAGKNAEALMSHRLVAVKSPTRAGEMTDLPLIETVGTSTGWAAWQKKFGALKQPSLYTDTYGLAMQLAADGNGVALVSEALAAGAMASGVLERVSDGAVDAAEGYYLSSSSTRQSASAFVDWLRRSNAS